MKENTGFKNSRCHAASCNLSGWPAVARGRQNRFDRAGSIIPAAARRRRRFVDALVENRARKRRIALGANQARFFFRCCEEGRFLRALSAASR